MSSFKQTWKQWPTYVIPPATVILLWALIFCWSVAKTIYEDHMRSESSNTELRRQLATQQTKPPIVLGKPPVKRTGTDSPVGQVAPPTSKPQPQVTYAPPQVNTPSYPVPTFKPASPYEEVRKARAEVGAMDASWWKIVDLRARGFSYEKNNDLQAAKDQFSDAMADSNRSNSEQWQKLEPTVDVAVRDALQLLSKYQNPIQQKAERDQYAAANPTKHRDESATFHKGEANRDIYKPMTKYLDKLEKELSDYPENP